MNGIDLPGKVIAINYERGKGYKKNPHIKDHSHSMSDFLNARGIHYIHLTPDIEIEGRSWEMACILGALGRSGVYSGTADFVGNMIVFGPVPGIMKKKEIAKDLKTHVDVPYAYSHM